MSLAINKNLPEDAMSHKIKRFFLLTISTFAISPIQNVNAQTSDVYFYPIRSWNVQNLNKNKCSISNEFNNGFILEIGSDGTSINMLGLNLRQNVFDAGTKYDTNVSFPGSNSYPSKGESLNSEAIAIDLKKGKEIFKSMRDVGVLDLSLKDNNFRFYLTGFSSAAKIFEQCMGVVPSPAPIAEALPAQEFGEPIEEAKRDLPPQSKKTSSAESKLKAQEEAQQNQNITKNDNYKTEPADDLIADLKDFVTPPPQDTKPQAAIQEEALNSLPEKTERIAQEENVENEIALPVEEPAQPKKIDLNFSEKTPEMKVNKTYYKKELDITDAPMLTKEISKISSQPPSFTPNMTKIVALEKRIEILNRENTQLNRELERSLEASEKERLDISSNNWNLEQATMKFNEAERQIVRLGQQVQKERARCEMDKQELELMLFDPELTSQAQLARLSSLEKELASKNAELQELRLKYETKIRQLNGGI